MDNILSFSTAPLTRIINKEYYDLENTLLAMKKLGEYSIIQGFEFQHLAEWDLVNPPKDDDSSGSRYIAWKTSKKYSIKDLAVKIEEVKTPIISIHGNRDIGILLCSDKSEDIKEGKRLIFEAINLSELLRANVCVFHFWDTWKEKLNYKNLVEILKNISKKYPKIVISVENIPTNIKNWTSFDLVKNFNWVTLDLRWAAIYDELDKFSTIKTKIINIHVRGELVGNKWVLKKSPFTVIEALDIILNEWNYKGILTFESEGGLRNASFENLVSAIKSIKSAF